MRTTARSACILASAFAMLLVSVLSAQKQRQDVASMLADMKFLTPITENSDSIDGLWTLGDAFKASFHDGFSFYTRSGDRTKALPLRWKTESILAGGEPVTTKFGLRTRHGNWRCEYFHGAGIVESYDVSAAGVEQSFWIPQRPATTGDLLITGRVTTTLRADTVDDAHAELLFRDVLGDVITGYGKAFAIDARGDEVEVMTTWDGARISLRVPERWLATASFPILVDPLFGTKTIRSFGAGNRPNHTRISIGQENRSKSHNILIAYAARIGDGGFLGTAETYVVVCNKDYTDPRVVHTRHFDNGSAFGNALMGSDCVAPVDGARRWVVTFWSPNPTDIYVHDFGDTTVGGGTRHTIPVPKDHSFAAPIVGGVGEGSLQGLQYLPGMRALIAFSLFSLVSDDKPSPAAIVFDAQTKSFVTGAFKLTGLALPGFAAQQLTINQVNAGSVFSPWIVLWRELSIRGGARMRGTLVKPDGTFKTLATFGPATVEPGLWRTRVAGSTGRYMMAFEWYEGVVPALFGSKRLGIQRFDWAASASAPTLQPMQTLVAPSGDVLRILGDIAYDSKSESNWVVVYSDRVVRLSGQGPGLLPRSTGRLLRVGSDGTIQEQQQLWDSSRSDGWTASVAVCFDPESRCFPVAFTEPPARFGSWTLRGTKFCSPPMVKLIGTGRGEIFAWTQKTKRSSSLLVDLFDAPAGQPATLLMGTERIADSLAVRGMPGSYLYVGGSVTAFRTTTSRSGTAMVSLPLPASTKQGLYFQWLIDDPKAKTLVKRVTSPGLAVAVR